MVPSMSAGAVIDGVLDLVFPKRCVQCRAVGAWLCERCAAGLQPLPAPRCSRCGAPGLWAPPGAAGRRERAAELRGRGASPRRADAAIAASRRCRECGCRDLAFTTATAAFVYEGPARALVGACKFGALRSLCDEMGRLALPAFTAACGLPSGRLSKGCLPAASVDLVTWVPAHRRRGLERGFNQAELLARRLARAVGLPYAPLLRRVRHGSRQSTLAGAARAANVRDAFVLREDVDGVKKKFGRVLVIDDVYTTGETLNQSAKTLVQEGLDTHVFTFARTIRSSPSQASLDNAVQKERCR